MATGRIPAPSNQSLTEDLIASRLVAKVLSLTVNGSRLSSSSVVSCTRTSFPLGIGAVRLKKLVEPPETDPTLAERVLAERLANAFSKAVQRLLTHRAEDHLVPAAVQVLAEIVEFLLDTLDHDLHGDSPLIPDDPHVHRFAGAVEPQQFQSSISRSSTSATFAKARIDRSSSMPPPLSEHPG